MVTPSPPPLSPPTLFSKNHNVPPSLSVILYLLLFLSCLSTATPRTPCIFCRLRQARRRSGKRNRPSSSSSSFPPPERSIHAASQPATQPRPLFTSLSLKVLSSFPPSPPAVSFLGRTRKCFFFPAETEGERERVDFLSCGNISKSVLCCYYSCPHALFNFVAFAPRPSFLGFAVNLSSL